MLELKWYSNSQSHNNYLGLLLLKLLNTAFESRLYTLLQKLNNEDA